VARGEKGRKRERSTRLRLWKLIEKNAKRRKQTREEKRRERGLLLMLRPEEIAEEKVSVTCWCGLGSFLRMRWRLGDEAPNSVSRRWSHG
jgi:hypothetical protein